MVKWTIVGKFTPGPRTDNFVLFRHWLMATLMPGADFYGPLLTILPIIL